MNSNLASRSYRTLIFSSAIITLSLSLLPLSASAAIDPFPGIATGQEIPGTRVSGAPGQSQSDFESSPAAISHTCPAGSGRGSGVDLNFTTSQADDVRYFYCVKTWSDPETGEAAERERERAVQDGVQAQAQIRANELGIQACLPWSYTWRNGVTQSSGSVCAMPNNLQTTAVSTPTPSPTASATPSPTPTAAPTTVANATPIPVVPTPTDSPTVSSKQTATSGSSAAKPVVPDRTVEDDGVEEEPTGSITVRKSSTGQYSILISTNLGSDEVRVAASKKGAKTIRWNVTTNEAGKVTIKTGRALSGFKLTLFYDDEALDVLKVNT
jgi:hypothetical protein